MIMKPSFIRYLTVAIVLAIFFSCNNAEEGEKSFEVQGTIKNTNATKVYLRETPMTGVQSPVTDSATIGKDGKFTIRTKVAGQKVFTLQLSGNYFPFASLVNDAGSMKVNADFSKSADLYTVE